MLYILGIVFKIPIPRFPELRHSLTKKFPTPPVVSSYKSVAPLLVFLKNLPTPSDVSLYIPETSFPAFEMGFEKVFLKKPTLKSFGIGTLFFFKICSI